MSSSKSKERLFFGALVLCWIYLAVGFIGRTPHAAIDGVRYFSIFDDGMISMRYAKNFVQHHGLVWNIGDRVEGFTCPLWTFLMVGAVWISGTHYAPLVMQILGSVIYIGILFVFYRTGVRTQKNSLGLYAGTLRALRLLSTFILGSRRDGSMRHLLDSGNRSRCSIHL